MYDDPPVKRRDTALAGRHGRVVDAPHADCGATVFDPDAVRTQFRVERPASGGRALPYAGVWVRDRVGPRDLRLAPVEPRPAAA